MDPRRGTGIDPDVATGIRPVATLSLSRQEYVELVLEERPADRPTVLVPRDRSERLPGEAVADEVVALMILEEGPVNLVRATTRDGVDQAAGEPALAHVEGGDEHLVLRDRVERDRLRVHLPARLPGAAKAEEVVVHRAVDLNVVEPVVLSGGRGASDLGGGLDEVGKVAGQGREARDQALGHELARAGARRRAQRGRHGFGPVA